MPHRGGRGDHREPLNVWVDDKQLQNLWMGRDAACVSWQTLDVASRVR